MCATVRLWRFHAISIQPLVTCKTSYFAFEATTDSSLIFHQNWEHSFICVHTKYTNEENKNFIAQKSDNFGNPETNKAFRKRSKARDPIPKERSRFETNTESTVPTSLTTNEKKFHDR